MKTPSLQLWSVRDDLRDNFARTLEVVAGIGYRAVELAGFGNLKTAAEAARVLTDLGVGVSGMHVGIDALRSNLLQVVDDAHTVGTGHVTVPWYPPTRLRTPAACAAWGEELAGIGSRLAVHGLRLSYHNHAQEIARLEGRTVLERILDAAAPRDLGVQVDLYWAHVGGENPAQLLHRLGDRVLSVHLKDGDGKQQTVVGRGRVEWTPIFAALEAIGTAPAEVVEQEQYAEAPLESVRLCFEQLKAWGRA